MTSCCNVTNSVCPVTKTTICHCPTLALGRGAYNQADAPGISRPLHATGRGAIGICLSEMGTLAKKRLGNTDLIVSREAISSEILITIEHSNCFVTTLQIAAMHSRIVTTSELKCKN